jgi:hypothetical protein
VVNAKIVTAGPRGNACRDCKEKIRKPAVILKVSGYNQYSSHPKVDNYCPKCGIERVKEARASLKEMLETLTNGPATASQLGSKKVRIV